MFHLDISKMKTKKTSKQLAGLQKKFNPLHCHILQWREIQLIYIPTVAIVLAALTTALPDDPDDITAEHSESLPLWFLSSLPAHLHTLPSLCKHVLTTVLLMYIYTACWLNNYVVQLCPFWCNNYGARLSRLLTECGRRWDQ